jgi:SH3-like domain-containing protein
VKRYSIYFIILTFIYTVGAAAERLTIVAPLANIRSGPGTKYDILWKVEKYYPIFVIGESDSWYHFRDFEDDSGWVHKSLVGKVPAVITEKDLCNIRSGPSTKEKILFSVERGIPFKILDRKGAWLHIEHADGDQGWIHNSLVW